MKHTFATMLGLLLLVSPQGHATAHADAGDDLYNFSLGLIRQKRYDDATKNLEKLLVDFPNHPKTEIARFRLGLTYLTQKQYKPAREHLRTFVARNADSQYLPEAMYQSAYSSYQLGEMKDADAEFEAFHKKYDENEYREWSLVYQGYARLQLESRETAKLSFESAIAEFPEGRMREDADFGLARVLELDGKVDDAVKIYRALAERPAGLRNEQAYMKLGNLLYDRRQFDLAAAEYLKLVEKFPRSTLAPAARLNAGYACFQMGEFQQAAENFDLAAAVEDQQVTALYWKGLSHKALEQWEPAIESLSKAAKVLGNQPQVAPVRFHWADCELRAARLDKAIPLFVACADADSKGEFADDALYFASEASLRTADFDTAEQLLLRLKKDYPQSALGSYVPLLQGRLALAKADVDNLKSAESLFREILESGEPPATRDVARFQLARALERQDRCDEALQILTPWTSTLTAESPAEFHEACLLEAECQRRLAATRFSETSALRKQLKALKSAPTPPDTSDLEAQIAEQVQSIGVHAEAGIAALDRYVSLQSAQKEGRNILLLRALCEALRGRQSESKAALDALTRQSPENADLWQKVFEIAEIAYDSERYTWALELYLSLVKLDRDTPWRPLALSGAGWSQSELKQYAQAADTFGTLVDDYPRHEIAPEAAYMRAESLRRDGKTAEAGTAFAAAFETYAPADAVGLSAATGQGLHAYRAGLEAARIARELKEYEAADARYARLLERFPELPQRDLLYREWALANLDGERYDRADELHRRLIEQFPESPHIDAAFLSLAESDFQAGRVAQARKAFAALAGDAEAESLLRERAIMHLVRLSVLEQKWDEVIRWGERFAASFPEAADRFDADFYRAEALLNLDRHDEADKLLLPLYERRDDPPVAQAGWRPRLWVHLAQSAVRRKDYPRVETLAAEMQSAEGTEPFRYQMREVLGLSYKNQAKFDEALAEFRGIIADESGQKTETAAKAQFLIGEIWLLRKEYKTALDEYLKVYLLYKAPEWQAPALYQAGLCDEALMQWDKALTSYEDLRRDFPQSEYAKRAAERIPAVKAKIGN